MSHSIIDQAVKLLREEMASYKCDQAHTFTNPSKVRDYLMLSLAKKEAEEFHVLFLNNQHGLIKDECMFKGTIDGASVYPREVIKRALELNAAAVILSHNHPSGATEASVADRQITRRLKDGLALVDIRILDHIIVAHASTVSFAETGLL
jgi:DNA repair protein RadC